MYSLVILVAALNFRFAVTVKHTSALMKRVQVVPSDSTPEKRIKCALELTKANQAAVKIAAGSCELLYFNDLTGVAPGYEYLEKTIQYEQSIPPGKYKEEVTHFVFSEVKVGDQFQFVIQKSNTDKFSINFRDGGSTFILVFVDGSSEVLLKDGYTDRLGEVVKPQLYPFSEFKVYKIVFHVLESHWQIDVDDVALTTFDYIRPFNLIKKITVKVGPAVIYRTKTSDPRLTE